MLIYSDKSHCVLSLQPCYKKPESTVRHEWRRVDDRGWREKQVGRKGKLQWIVSQPC